MQQYHYHISTVVHQICGQKAVFSSLIGNSNYVQVLNWLKQYGVCLQLKLELICRYKCDRYLILIVILVHLQKINVNYHDFKNVLELTIFKSRTCFQGMLDGGK